LASSAVVERKRAGLGLIRAQASLAEADEINWAVSAYLGTLQMIEADYQFDVNFAEQPAWKCKLRDAGYRSS